MLVTRFTALVLAVELVLQLFMSFGLYLLVMYVKPLPGVVNEH